MERQLPTSETLRDVKYEIRGQLAHQADELEKRGYEIISLNIGNPGLFGFRTPETMRLAMIENLGQAEPYCHQKGIFPAREAVVMQQQDRGNQAGQGEHAQSPCNAGVGPSAGRKPGYMPNSVCRTTASAKAAGITAWKGQTTNRSTADFSPMA